MLLLCFESDFCGPPPRPGQSCCCGPNTPAQGRTGRQGKARTAGGDSQHAPSPGPGSQAKGGGVKRGPAAATRRRPAARQPGSGGEIPSVLGSQANGSAPPTQSFARIRNGKNRQSGGVKRGPAAATRRRPAARQPGSGGEIPSVLGSQANGSAPPTQSFARIRNGKNRQNGSTRKSATKRKAHRVPPEIVNLINTGFRFSGKFQGLIYRCRAGKQQVFRSCQLN